MNALRRFLVTLFALGAVAAAAWYGWREWDMRGAEQSTEDAYVRGEITVLSPRVSGYVVEILADDNTRVEPKQTLVRIDPRDYRATVDRSEAAVGQAEASLTQARAKLGLQKYQIEVAEAALDSANAQAANATVTLARARELLAKGSGTQVTFDNANAADVSARSAVAQAQSQLDLQRNQLNVLDADVKAAEAQLRSAQATLGTAKLALEDTQIWSPIAGIVANRVTRVGEYVTVGARMLSIVPRSGLWIEANFRETQLAAMKFGQSVSIHLDLYGGRRICGYVDDVGPASGSEFALVPPDNATGNFTKIVRRFPVRIRPNASEIDARLLKPGMSTTVRVAIDSAEIEGCRFRGERDRQPSSLPLLPPHPGLQREAAQSANNPTSD